MNSKSYSETEETVEELKPEDGKLSVRSEVLPTNISILPLTQRPLFPGITLPLAFTGKDKLETLRKAVEEEEGYIGLVLAREYQESDYAESDFHEVGLLYQIMRVAPASPGMLQVLGRGVGRFKREKVILVKPQLRWAVKHHQDSTRKPDPDLKAYMMAISSDIKELLQLNPLFQEQINMVVSQLNSDAPGLTMDVISNLLSADAETLQQLLETFDLHERAKMLLRLVKEEAEVAKIQKKINQQIEEKISSQQREFFLREQLKAIKKELGMDQDGPASEAGKLEQRLAQLDLPEEVEKVARQELEKLKSLNEQSPEFGVTRNYLETIADLPWGIFTEDNVDIREARRRLEADHHGLEEVKNRILEFLSAIAKRGKVGGSIICLVGPPGVGKTSIGKSVANALGRKFFRFSVGGMRDEAEIKGHRRTYIGAMPGKFLQALKRAGASNPVILIDEIDKVGASYRGDPASALLEVLDPEQNTAFMDHYLDLPYDLSKVLFITTANQLETIPGPLLDRMEIIRLPGYVLEEKIEIAKRHLIPKLLEDQGFQADEIQFNEQALSLLIDRYAREAGVRNLEQQIRKIIRKIGLKQAESEEISFVVDRDEVERYLGKPVFNTERLYNKDVPGVALGLAYTPLGGATLYIEAAGIHSPKGGGFKHTGQLGDVMKESSEIAYSFVRSLISRDKHNERYFDENVVHLHVPAGATPKDGPSAGITMALSLYSLATQRPVRADLAMTGELTLTGKVLPIGGVKEKTIAARRVGIHEVILPADNRRDFEALPAYIKEGITVHYADYFDDVLAAAF